MTTSMEVSFPRGKSSSHHGGDDKKDDKKHKHDGGGKTKKRPAADFLFGGPDGGDDKQKRQQQSQHHGKRHKQSKTESKTTTLTKTSRSVLPAGGGAVVHPAKGEGWIEALGFSKLHAGFAMLGVVRQVHDDLCVFSLPNQWTGFMLRSSSHNNKEDHHTVGCHQMLQVGQMLAVRIVKAVQESTKEGPRRRIQVTALPHKVNAPTQQIRPHTMVRGQVMSIEDHGCLVDLGWQRRGFLKFQDIQGPYQLADEGQNDQEAMDVDHDHETSTTTTTRLGVGRILDFYVAGMDAQVASLQLLAADEAAQKLSITNLPPLEDLQPGTLVHCVLDKMVRNGLCVSFGAGVYRGAIDLHHLGGYWLPDHRQESKDWRDIFDKHRAFKARIIAVDAAAKIVRLSLQKHLLDMTLPKGMPILGDIYQGTVVRLDEGVGALLALPDLQPPVQKEGVVASSELYDNESYQQASRVQCAYVHISKAMTAPAKGKVPEVAFTKEFAPSTKHRVRILNTSNMIEGIVSGAAADDIVDAQVLSYSDLEPGKVFKQVPIIRHLESGAIIVNFGMGITAQVPANHLFDKNATSEFRIRMRKVKYAINAKIDVRVLTVDAAHKKCFVTAKKSLVNATDIITNYENITAGQRSVGFVSKIDTHGISVTFFNGVFGRVTKRSLRNELGLDSASEQYSVGDVVSCQVAQIKKRTNRRISYSDDGEAEQRAYYEITLTMREAKAPDDGFDDDTEVHIRTGTVLSPKSLRVLELVNGKTRDGVLIPGYAIVEVKAKHVLREAMKGSTIECKLPFDQLFDEYDIAWLQSPNKLDKEAAKVLAVGEKINQKSLVLTDPKKSSTEYKSGTGRLTLLSLRPKLIQLVEKGQEAKHMLPSPDTEIYVGAKVAGYVCRIDPRFGAFVRFLDDLTGLVPKLKGGNDLPLYSTVKSKIIAIDVAKKPPKILLGKATPISSESDTVTSSIEDESPSCRVGDVITNAEVEKIDFHRAIVKAPSVSSATHQIRVHCTMAPYRKKNDSSGDETDVGECDLHHTHPFYRWKAGMGLPPLKVVSIQRRKRLTLVDVQVTEPASADKRAKEIPEFFQSANSLLKGQQISGIVGNPGGENNSGLWVMIGPELSGFLPTLEMTDSKDQLDHTSEKYPRGSRITCTVVDVRSGSGRILLTVKDRNMSPPRKGDTVLGRINRKGKGQNETSLSVEVAGGYTGYCCITELKDREEWTNLPLAKGGWAEDEDGDLVNRSRQKKGSDLRHGAVLSFKVLDVSGKDRKLHLSLRRSRMDGNLEDDKVPEVGEITQAYVIATNKNGCFLRVSREVVGRSILKNLSDGFLADPAASFPPGRLVVGKVVARREGPESKASGIVTLDLNLRESAVTDAKKAVDLKDIEIGQKYHGTVSRIEDYGVFVQLEGSSVFGLVHKSECSDRFIADVSKVYSPGDLVKVFVLKKDESKKQVGLSMKASYFTNDKEDDEILSDADEAFVDDGSDDEEGSHTKGDAMEVEDDSGADDDSKENDSEDDDSHSNSDGSDNSESNEEDITRSHIMEMDVGFEWNAGNQAAATENDKDSSDEDSDSEDDASVEKGNHSRKNRSARRREEKHISEREKSLADGTADENPETAGDYERLVTSHPNSSELWIRYMAFHLSLADLDAARRVAERAIGRIEFREEREKLNVWCALLTLEIKYGTEESVNETIKRASAQSNPKQVHLRVCEIMEKELSQGGEVTRDRVDDMFAVTCKKFKSKKKVWIAHAAYLLRNGKYEEALAVSKRALLSLPQYKHTEMMSRMAQLMYEHERAEQARTVFDGLLAKNPKRLDLLSVYIDKEVKHGSVEVARQLFKDVAGMRSSSRSMKLSEKQMKKLFKRWYAFEESHGTEETCEAVKQAAVEYIEGK